MDPVTGAAAASMIPALVGGGGAAAGAAGGSGLMSALMGAGTLSSLFGSLGASGAEERAAKKAAEAQMAMYRQTRADLAPWRTTGQAGAYSLADLLGIATPGRDPSARFGEYAQPITREQVQLDPGYQFRQAEGEKAIQRAQAARGNIFAGQAGKELLRYGQGLASEEYGRAYGRTAGERADYFNRLMGLSEAGRGAATQTGAFGAGAAGRAGELGMAGGRARGAGYTGGASALGQGMQNYMTYEMMKNPAQFPGMTSY